MLERYDDMALTGTRNPFLGRYKVAVDARSGKIHAYELHLFANAGHSLDLSYGVMSQLRCCFAALSLGHHLCAVMPAVLYSARADIRRQRLRYGRDCVHRPLLPH